MKRVLSGIAMSLAAGFASGQTTNFDLGPVGQPPANWQCGVMGSSSPKCSVERDAGQTSDIIQAAMNDRYAFAPRLTIGQVR